MNGDPEEERGPWCAEEAECEWCHHTWAAVHPAAERLECPKCGRFSKSLMAEKRDEWLRKELS